MRNSGFRVTNPLATNSVNLCAMNHCNMSDVDDNVYFALTSTCRLVYNSNQVKLSAVSVLSVCIDLSRRELFEYLISNVMGTRSHYIIDICKSILGEGPLDAVWCSWILVNYLCSHARGRALLKQSKLTDVDIQSAIAFERYGGEEIRRRVRQDRVRPTKKRRTCEDKAKRKGNAHASTNTIASDVDLVENELEPLVDMQMDGKRKRSVSGLVPCASDSHSMLAFWHQALQSRYVSVLHTLAAHNKRTARDAALSTLARQSEGTDVGGNEILKNVSLTNATKSAQALVSFVGRRVEDVPAILAFRAPNLKTGGFETVFGTQRIDKEGASSTVHACTLPHASMRPDEKTRIAIAWGQACKKLIPTSESTACVPGIMERYRRIRYITSSTDTDVKRSVYDVSAKNHREVSVMESFVDTESEMAMLQSIVGTSRSFLSIHTVMTMNHTHFDAASAMFEEAKQLKALVEADEKADVAVTVSSHAHLMRKSQVAESRVEPLCTPASPLAVGIGTNEMMRKWMSGKTRKNDPCRKHLGVSSPSEMCRDVPNIASSEPLPMLTITDVEMERVGEATPTSPLFSKVGVSLGIHVCGDCAVRLPELLSALALHTQGDALAHARQARAALFVSASQASFIGVVASSLASGYTNASVASSKKISVRVERVRPARWPFLGPGYSRRALGLGCLFTATPHCFVAGS